MTTIRKAWLGMMLVSAGLATAITYRARQPDYEAVAVPELTLCQVFMYGAGRQPGDFELTDCKTGKEGRRGQHWPRDQDANAVFHDVCGKGATAFRKAGGSCAVLP